MFASVWSILATRSIWLAHTLTLNETEHESPKTTEQALWEFLNKLRAPA